MPNYTLNPYAIPLLVVALLSLAASSMGLIRERTSKISITLFVLGCFVSLWFFAFAWMYLARTEATALWWAKAAYLGVPFIPTAIITFTVSVLNTYRRDKAILSVGWILSLAFSILAVRTDLLIRGVHHYWWGYYSSYGKLGIPFLTFAFALMVLSLCICWTEFRRTPAVRAGKKQRIKIIAVAHLLGLVTCVDFFAKYGIAVYPIGYLGVFGVIVLFLVATWRYQLVNLTPAFAGQKIIDTMAESLLVLDYEGVISRVNNATLRLLGYREGELIEQPIYKILVEEYDGGLNRPKDGFEELMGRGVIRDKERSYRAKDGRIIPVHFSSSIMHDRFGKIQGVVCLASDITESKKAMEDLKKAKEAAEAASVAKSQFLAKMSHEIRTPMNGILGAIELLLDAGVNERQRKICETALRSGDALMGIIEDVLDLSKIEAGKLKLEQVAFKIGEIVEEVIEMFSERAYTKGLKMICVSNNHLSDTLLGDPIRIRQILINLIGNAIKFTDKGKVTLQVKLMEEADDQVHLRFEVGDTGTGIPAEMQPSIFDSFSQADQTTARRYGGAGLGLAISKQLVEMMEGSIGFQSTPGAGSTFWFAIPLMKQDGPAMGSAFLREELQGVRVLIVGDDAQNRGLLQDYIISWGMKGACAEGAQQALRILHAAVTQNQPYDIAILDLPMLGMEGPQLAQVIKSDPAIADICLIILGPENMKYSAAEVKADCILKKPVKGSQLFDCVTTLISKNPILPAESAYGNNGQERVEPQFTGHVLVAEDNPVNQEVIRGMLETLGLEADIAPDGQAAVEAACNVSYDLIFMDCHMPTVDGFEATTAIRREVALKDKDLPIEGSRQPHIPIIALTADVAEETRGRCLAAGMDDYLPKPFKKKQLLSILRRFLSQTTIVVGGPKAAHAQISAIPSSPEQELAPKNGPLDVQALDAIGFLQKKGAPDILAKVIDLYITDAPELLYAMDDALTRGDGDALTKAAHTFKSSSSNVGALNLSSLLKELETMGRMNSMKTAPDLLCKVAAEYAAVEDALKAKLRGNNGGTN
jgi:PAS domain S-box-containing protein